MKPRARILVVDDDPLNIEVLRELLAAEYDVVEAAGGEQGLASAMATPPDLILLDIMMPGIDGYETTRRLRAAPGLGHVKVILVSAKTTTVDRVRGYASGADDYLTKPFDHDELRAKVAVFLRLKTAEELGELKSELLNLVAHEIRTPLTGILPAAEILLAEPEMDADERGSWLEMILDNGRRLSALAEQGMELCRLRSQPTLRANPVDVVALAQRIAERTPGRVTIDAPTEAAVCADLRLLEMALVELVDSALAEADAQVSVRLRATAEALEIELPGFGEGYDEVEFSELFDDFGARSRDGQVIGARLNLALAHEVMRAHGGDLALVRDARGAPTLRGWLPLA